MVSEILVIGAGAAGLAAARALSAAGKNVTVIEARNRPGGRVHTIYDHRFPMRIEGGAEFVHGDLPYTIRLLREAKLNFYPLKGNIWNAQHDKIYQQKEFMEGSDLLLEKLEGLKQDMSIAEFLDTYFGDKKYENLRSSVCAYVQGYDLAEPHKASALGLKEEWSEHEEPEQYRIEKGYGSLISFLYDESQRNGCLFHFNTIAKEIHWGEGKVRVITSGKESFEANQLILTIPLGVWQSGKTEKAHIDFFPAIPEKQKAANELGFGNIVKVILEFNEPFWENESMLGERRMKDLGFLFSNELLPTWWTQLPVQNSILTGWFGGPDVKPFIHLNEKALLRIAIDSLSSVFKLPPNVLFDKLKVSRVFNWSADDFSKGGYAYRSLHADHNKKILSFPLNDTLFFAGEALALGAEAGTVEAALSNGAATAGEILLRNKK